MAILEYGYAVDSTWRYGYAVHDPILPARDRSGRGETEQALVRQAERAGEPAPEPVPKWPPNRLRHTVDTPA